MRSDRLPGYDRSVEADFSVELGADDETLEMPWSGGADSPKYFDLKHHPELLPKIEEAVKFPEMAEFLLVMNSPSSFLETAKCDLWSSTDINPEEEIFGGTHKSGSYVDVLFCDEKQRFSFEHHERFAKQITQLLKKAPEIAASAQFLIRRCFYHVGDHIKDGFYITFFLFGYGDDHERARQRWSIGLDLAENAIRQASRTPAV